MSSLDDRKAAYENKFVHDEEFRFKVEAKAVKLFGLWVAEQLGLNGEAAQTYAGQMLALNLEEAGFDEVKRKAHKDCDAKGVSVSDHKIDVTLEKCLAEAKSQLS